MRVSTNVMRADIKMDGRADKRGEALPPAVIVAGPTASGKSALAVALAERLGGWVINADALQIYRELKILTARPGAAEEGRAPHRLYGVLSAHEACSAGRWRALALKEMTAATDKGCLPILTGGTGLYLRALARGLAQVPPIPQEVRTRARSRMAEIGPEAFCNELAERDPESAQRLGPSDRQRLLRAWEVLEATGRKLADWQANGQLPAPYRFGWIILEPERAALFAAIDARAAMMMSEGAIEEVRALNALNLPADRPALKAVGVAELTAVLRGELDETTALTAMRQATRRYAKRQLTWLRHQTAQDIETGKSASICVNEQYSERLLPRLINFLQSFGLTR